MVTALPLVLMLLGLALGFPIAFTLMGSGILGLLMLTGSWDSMATMVGNSMYRGASDYMLTTIPMFILMAYFITNSGMAKNLYAAAASWLSNVSGGLAIATVFSGAVFGALCGASVAAASVLTEVAMPNMREHKYADELSTSSVSLGAVLSLLIPPSIAMVVYGIMTEVSINRLLIALIVPGFLTALFLALIIWIWVKIDPSLAPAKFKTPWRKKAHMLVVTWPSVVLIVLMLAMLYSGVITASEVAAIGAFAALAIAIILRKMSWATFVLSVRDTLRTTAMIFGVLIGATIFGYYVTLTRVPQSFVSTITSWNLDPNLVVAVVVISFFIMAMVVDETPLMILTLPFTFPLVTSLGFDPVWFGVINIMMVTMGLVFPPVGMICFVVSAASRVDVVRIYRGTSILIAAEFIVTILMVAFPWLATWLPSLIG